jgi:hypothetical protein
MTLGYAICSSPASPHAMVRTQRAWCHHAASGAISPPAAWSLFIGHPGGVARVPDDLDLYQPTPSPDRPVPFSGRPGERRDQALIARTTPAVDAETLLADLAVALEGTESSRWLAGLAEVVAMFGSGATLVWAARTSIGGSNILGNSSVGSSQGIQCDNTKRRINGYGQGKFGRPAAELSCSADTAFWGQVPSSSCRTFGRIGHTRG